LQNWFRIGESHHVEPSLNSVTGPTGMVRLEPKVMQVLVCLANHAGGVVAKELFMQTVWPDTFVTDDVLTRAISELRRLFGDEVKEPRFIQTIPKSGYRLIARACFNDTEQEIAAPEHAAQIETVTGLTVRPPASGDALRPSIAVLPFENISSDRENEYFSDGLAEEIINALTRISDLKVIARTSAFAFKGKHQDIRRIAETLGVAHVLEGSVRRAGSRIRVTAQLISAADGSHQWSGKYDRELGDVFAIQDEIAAAIAGAFALTLSGRSARRPRYIPALPAYESYLKGLYYVQDWAPKSMAGARKHFEHAIALDPGFALAHIELGHALVRMVELGLMSSHEGMPVARTGALQALAIDGSLAEGYALAGLISAVYDYDWPEADRLFRLAMQRAAVPPQLHGYYAHYYLLPIGRAGEAVEHHTLALREDPLNLATKLQRAVCLRAAERHVEGNEELRQLLELHGTFHFPYFMLGMNHALDGQLDDALMLAEQGYRLAPWFTPTVGLLAAMLKRAGKTDRAESLARNLGSGDASRDPIGPAIFHLLCDDIESAVDWTETAIEQRQPAVFFFLNAHGKALRSSARWPALARMMNLPVDQVE
jgi:TolB-like protein